MGTGMQELASNNDCAFQSRKISVSGKMFLLLVLLCGVLLSGCRTYYGYDDAYATTNTPAGKTTENIRHFVVFNIRNNEIRLDCFRKYDLCENTIRERKIIGKNEYYADFDGDYYLEDALMNPLIKWDFVLKKWSKSYLLVEKFDGNPLWYLIPYVGQLALVLDSCIFSVALTIDTCVTAGSICWSTLMWPSVWFGGRLLGWMGDWELAAHKPNILTLFSYMPFVNLFFPWQTPPYMADRPYYPTEVRGKEYEKVISRKKIIKTTAQQQKHTSLRLNAAIFCGKQKIVEKDFVTDNRNGSVELTQLFQQAIKTHPFVTERDFTFDIKLYDRHGNVLKERRCSVNAVNLMSENAKADFVSCRSGDVDQLNKILLRHRSHWAWREELLDDNFTRLNNDINQMLKNKSNKTFDK